MKWKRGRRSGDLVDRRGGSGRAVGIGAGLGLPVILVIIAVNLLSGGGSGMPDIGDVLGGLQGGGAAGQGLPPGADPDAKLVDFVSFVLDDVQNFWSDSFEQSGKDYERAQLVLFAGSTSSACGGATSDIGPHYCPPDQHVYLDLDFFKELKRRFGAPGDFAQAYVIAHEIGHHVQNLLGIDDKVLEAARDDPGQRNELSVRQELQADCFAGVWAFTTYERDILESGDFQEGLDAAAAVGDDRIQEQSGQRIEPEKWTHGSSEQRTRWFRKGFEDGDPNVCDTFSAESL